MHAHNIFLVYFCLKFDSKSFCTSRKENSNCIMNKSFIETFIMPKTKTAKQACSLLLTFKMKIKNDFVFLSLYRQGAENEKRKKVGKLRE